MMTINYIHLFIRSITRFSFVNISSFFTERLLVRCVSQVCRRSTFHVRLIDVIAGVMRSTAGPRT